ncbi:TetR family transcriptional regulator [Glycomyces sp. NEAU-7082]|uniref:TetR family transcriptional regulator n=2 Tax=Glycomyces albidus TaxID=2656774 RepID=A0A6L5G7F7_9ACTN|nr:TetR family transcriptional regulator [Glycomyces albidus]
MDMVRASNRLTADDWADAALVALEAGGLAAVAVEPLARDLGATKGSFYWHFKNREALIEAAVLRWERRGTEEVIAAIEDARLDDPVERLRRLFEKVIEHGATHRIETALAASADHPTVAAVLARVGRRRIEYVTALFEAAGFAPAPARHRAVISVSMYYGMTHLAATAAEALPRTREERKALVAAALESLLA